MGRIGRTYPRHEASAPVIVPVAPERLLFVRKGLAQRLPAVLWLGALVTLILLGWPAA